VTTSYILIRITVISYRRSAGAGSPIGGNYGHQSV